MSEKRTRWKYILRWYRGTAKHTADGILSAPREMTSTDVQSKIYKIYAIGSEDFVAKFYVRHVRWYEFWLK